MPYINTGSEVKAILEQLNRVNGQSRAAAAEGDPATLRRQLADANARIVKLERQLAEARLLIASYEDAGSAAHRDGLGVGMTYRGAQRITAKEAAQILSISLSTVSRYCESGFWRAERDASGRWLIDASQDLRKKPRGSVGTRRVSSARSKSRQ